MNPDRDPFDPTLDALLHAHSDETPSPEVDAAILAAAHRAVLSGPRAAEATSPWRWWMPLAAAATIGAIAIGVLQLISKETEPTTATVVSDTPPSAPAASDRPVAPPAASPGKDKVEAPRVQAEAPRAEVRADRVAPKPSTKSERAAAPEPFPARERDAGARELAESIPSRIEAESKSQPMVQGNAAGTFANRVAPQAAAPAIAKQSAAADAQIASPEQWIARIRALLADGKHDAAARELNGFRTAYADADARLPADLRAWAATVKR